MQSIERLHQRSSIIVASAWMVGLTLLLFFLPAINGLIGGFVGGYKVGSSSRALGAAVLPAVIASFGLWVLLWALELPVIGFLAGLATAIIILLADIGIFIGAFVGGLMSNKRASPT